MSKSENVLGVIGLILLIGGSIATIPLALQKLFTGLIFSGLSVIIGIILTVYAFSD